MANDTTVDQQQLQSTIDELYRKLTDALKAQLGTINIGENQALGLLSTADDLASAPVGDQATLLNAIGLGVLSGAINVTDLAAFRDAIGVVPFDPNTLGALASLDIAPIENGGTGASAADAARENLGLGSAATYDDSRYAKISGGSDAAFAAMPLIGDSPIIERGSNANGYYVKYADGTAECWNQQAGINSAPNPNNWTFPITLVDANRTYVSCSLRIRDGNFSSRSLLVVGALTTSAGVYGYGGNDSAASQDFSKYTLMFYAIGRWK